MSADGASDGQGSSEEGDRAASEENASYDHEEISEDSEDAEDYEPETGIQVRVAVLVSAWRDGSTIRLVSGSASQL